MDDQRQGELPMPFPDLSGDMPLLPARMVNEYSYCPRLAYLEWVQGEWAESGDTVEGRHVHRRVDKPGGKLPEPGAGSEDDRLHARSITLSSNRLGLIAKMDLVESEGDKVTPVDYKRGKRPHVSKGAYEPERVQLCIQAMILEEHGYRCDEGVLYFAGSKERVRVVFDEELREATMAAVNGLRFIAAGGQMPPPLEDSPKCPRCSLVGICLPDEVNFLQAGRIEPRPMAVGRDEALPLYVQSHRAKVAKKGETLEVTVDDTKAATARLLDVSQLVLMGNVYVTTPTLHELMRREIPITWHSYGGWFLGHTVGTGHKNVELRTAQYQASFDERACLMLAKGLVRAKILNCRTLLRRNWRGDGPPDEIVSLLKRDAEAAQRAKSLDTLLGIEGSAAARYFGAFSNLIKKNADTESFSFDFNRRNRRPPTDPVNALLSYAYSLLTRSWTVALTAVGFDPYRGFYHQPRYGRPALALDMMEPFRPLLADSSVLTAINNAEVRPSDFISAAGSVALTNDGRKRFIAAFERRLSQEITHPLFGYRVSYRRLLEVQARLLGRHLLGELAEYPNFLTR
ncbi:CRISPR-associated exonuclease Cas4/endonuclease Cas1 fusion [Thiohalobacter sp. COW1]|uniref:CRISPR-associated endonuclease Cas4g/Cas1g n=1 Tax=Thiohalobacter sp. COW1 TaxID=2795687 RepID=UPI001915F77B|nr:CRISPR-associated endonuclease Cas1 [Thiohalobacter sp. COW1]BCO32900.1 CRISPR-associated exonuclease Cas4/endonuclease Cas1 fusion [Thiohalobacter sp. COW1]